MNKILKLLQNNVALKQVLARKGSIVINENYDEAYLLACAFLRHKQSILIIKNSQYQALKLYQALKEMIEDVVYFASDESLRVEAIAYSEELLSERIHALNKLTEKPCICVTHTHAALRHVVKKEVFESLKITLKVGQEIEPTLLRRKVIELGYHQETRVDAPFQFSKRGGVFDIYSINNDHPVRIEFFDNEIESITFYDEQTQKRTDKIKEITLLPATDFYYTDEDINLINQFMDNEIKISSLEKTEKEELIQNIEMDKQSLENHDYSPRLYQYYGLCKSASNLFDYHFDLVIASNKEAIHTSYKQFTEESFFYYKELENSGNMLPHLKLYYPLNEIESFIQMEFKTFKTKDSDISFLSESVEIAYASSKNFQMQLNDYLKLGRVLLCIHEKNQLNSMIQLLDENNYHYTLVGIDDEIYPGLNVFLGNIPFGIRFVEEDLTIITSHELYKKDNHQKKYIKYKNAITLSSYNELAIGDYVVHDTNGIGQYMGIKTLEVSGIKKDFLYIAYKGNDILYVPVENFKLIRKYASRDGHVPKVHALNSSAWTKEKAKVRQKVDGLADSLIALYSERLKQKGFAFAPDNQIQKEFEQEFGYDLTSDQKKAVDEIKSDMMKDRPMDRLLCGDVGFGKTEVALRAMMKAVLSDKQCAFLCPTTILSNQHYQTMIKRFEGFPVTIELLNRFTSTKKRKEIIQDLKAGKIDILVGTHRILSKDIEFKDLGFLCIDEEQRFGVRQKEKIKEYRKTIDVLVLSATPIPRTLQMSLMGVRGLSQIETPPLNRLPVQTYVIEQNEALIKQVIERELGRDGQVFYVHNNTNDIYEVSAKIQRLLPDAKVGVGHGKMKKEELEEVMRAFCDKEYDILVSTTIIETGIDIPNANTIIVENADHFGLSQLYQIKGRVGRSNRLAYAYLLFKRNKQMNEEATKRLKAIKEFTQLGSGYKIAMRDLSIRGSGDILGGEQAGFIDSIGFDMYMKILQDALKEKQGITEEKTHEVPVRNVLVDGYIPDNYVDSDYEKLELYQKIYHANHLKELEQVENELKDFYGKLPREVENIVIKRKFEILSDNKKLKEVKDTGKGITLHFTREFSQQLDGEKVFLLANTYLDKSKFNYHNFEIQIEIPLMPDYVKQTTKFMEAIL